MSIAEELASKQRQISVAEFFERNRQVLGFDNTLRAVLTTVKEAVDNSIDAAEEAQVLPEVLVEIVKLGEERLKISVEDNGPGIVRREVPNVFGRLLYGSRFHANRQARGQQGIGISAAVLYAGLTTATPAHIISKIKEGTTAIAMDLMIDTSKNQPVVMREEPTLWDGRSQGTRIELTLKGKYQRGRASPYEYLKGTAIVNPHVRLTLIEPDGTRTLWERVVSESPPLPREIPPHPHGMELGELLQRLKRSSKNNVKEFLIGELSGIFSRTADELLTASGISPRVRPGEIPAENVEKLLDALRTAKVAPPPTDCLSPIGPLLIKRGLKNVLGAVKPEFYANPVSRPPKVHSGCPFIVEVGLVYGGGLPSDEQIQLLRFANRVPLLFQQGACAITQAVTRMDWKRYGLEHKAGALPVGPVVLLVHVVSTKVPFTSEAKEAVAETEDIDKEITLAVQAAARNLSLHISRRERRGMAEEKFIIVRKILPKLAEKTSVLVDRPVPDLTPVITKIMNVVAVEAEGEKALTGVTLTNYTSAMKEVKVFMELPQEALGDGFVSTPKAEDLSRENGRLTFGVIKLKPSERFSIRLSLPKGVDVGPPDADLFVAGVDEAHLLGADPLPGDWDVTLPEELVTGSKEEDEEPAGTEVDYDAAEKEGKVDDEE